MEIYKLNLLLKIIYIPVATRPLKNPLDKLGQLFKDTFCFKENLILH